MKYGVVLHKDTKNIGDDIQSYAASQWLPQVDYYITRDDMESFKPDEEEPVALIMSHWYMWRKWNWPPSKYINPLWIGFHYTDQRRGTPRGMSAKFEYIKDGAGRDYLRSYGPIGCRDPYTVKVLQGFGIDAYFSGCVTLTIQKRDIPKPKKEYIVLTDIDEDVEKVVRKQLEGSGIDIVTLKANRPRDAAPTIEERMAEVEHYLSLYQNAKCVLTFRLHAMLPCLALETPVLLVRKDFNSIRFQPYKDWVHKATPKQVIAGEFKDFLFNPPANPDTYKATRESLIKTITEFIDNCKKETRTVDELVKTSYSEVEFLRWKNQALKVSLEQYHIDSREDMFELIRRQRKIDKLTNENANLRKQIKSLNSGSYELVVASEEANALVTSRSRVVKFLMRIASSWLKFRSKGQEE